MVSRLLRRSGHAVWQVCEAIEWRPDVVYQVGIGQYHEEVKLLKEEWPELKLIGCEPMPEIDLTDYPGTVHRVALSDHDGLELLNWNTRHKDGASLREPDAHPDRKIDSAGVRVTTLDKLFPKIEPGRLLLWLDCEGSELDVLRGGRFFLKHVSAVNVELTANPPGAGWCRPEEVHEHLVREGFFLQWIHTQRICSGQVDAVYVRRELFRSRFCCLPTEVTRFYEGCR